MKKERANILISILLILVIILAIISRQKYLNTQTENYQQQQFTDLSFLYIDNPISNKKISDYSFSNKSIPGKYDLYDRKKKISKKLVTITIFL